MPRLRFDAEAEHGRNEAATGTGELLRDRGLTDTLRANDQRRFAPDRRDTSVLAPDRLRRRWCLEHEVAAGDEPVGVHDRPGLGVDHSLQRAPQSVEGDLAVDATVLRGSDDRRQFPQQVSLERLLPHEPRIRTRLRRRRNKRAELEELRLRLLVELTAVLQLGTQRDQVEGEAAELLDEYLAAAAGAETGAHGG